MDRLKGWLKQLRVLVAKERVERELDDEMTFHLEMETARRVREGLDPAEARRAARQAFGGLEQAKEQVRDARWVRGLDNLLADLRLGVRALVARPGYAAAAVVTLALGIGGSTAVFSVVRATLLAPLPYEQPDRLVRLYQVDAQAPGEQLAVSAPHFRDYRELASSFEHLAALYTFHEVGTDLTLGDHTERVVALPVTADYFQVLRTEPNIGRSFVRHEESGATVAMVSERLWRRAGLDRQGLGATISLDGTPHTVIGVLPAEFSDPLAQRVDIWLPQRLDTPRMRSPDVRFLTVLGRLAPGVTPDMARDEMATLDAALNEKYAELDGDGALILVPLHEDLVAGARPALLVAFGAVVLVLLIACVNLASLLLIRALGRLQEIAVRSALGAQPTRIAAQLLVESLLIAGAGAAAGVAVAHFGLRTLLELGREAIPQVTAIGIDLPLLVGAALAAGLTALAAGLLPTWRLARTSPLASLRTSTRSATSSRRVLQLRRGLVAGQVGLAFTLLVGAAALGTSLLRQARLDLGIRTTGIVTFQLNLPTARYDASARERLHRRLPSALAALPGVERAAGTTVLPASGTAYSQDTRVTRGPLVDTPRGVAPADQRIVSGDYFATLDIPLLDGRSFDARDTPESEAVALISESLARRLFDGSALGQPVEAGGRNRMIIGVVGDVALDPDGAPGRHVYHAHAQWPGAPPTLEYLLATRVDLEALLPALRRTVAALDPELVVHRPMTLDDALLVRRGQRRFAFALTAAFATLALVLAGVGLYGVLAYVVRRRRREIGVRVALGAGPTDILRVVVHDALVMTLAGLAVGAVGALAIGRPLSSLVFETAVTEPAVLAASATILVLVAVAASLLPVARAMRVSPRTALHEA